MNEVALRYADALYSLALEKKCIDAYKAEINQLQKLLFQNPEFVDLLSSAFVPEEEKEKIIDSTLVGVNDDIKSLFKVVIKNHRIKYLLDILRQFNSLCNEYRGVKEGLLYSTIHLSETKIEEISKAVAKEENCDIELINIIDPSLIGGVRVVVNDHIYDGSLKNQLEELKRNIK